MQRTIYNIHLQEILDSYKQKYPWVIMLNIIKLKKI